MTYCYNPEQPLGQTDRQSDSYTALPLPMTNGSGGGIINNPHHQRKCVSLNHYVGDIILCNMSYWQYNETNNNTHRKFPMLFKGA